MTSEMASQVLPVSLCSFEMRKAAGTVGQTHGWRVPGCSVQKIMRREGRWRLTGPRNEDLKSWYKQSV